MASRWEKSHYRATFRPSLGGVDSAGRVHVGLHRLPHPPAPSGPSEPRGPCCSVLCHSLPPFHVGVALRGSPGSLLSFCPSAWASGTLEPDL